MITCPICEKLVRVPPNVSDMCRGLEKNSLTLPGQEINLRDGSPDDFCCNTYVEVHPGIRWCHYTRFTRHFISKPSQTIMQAIVPPFEVLWSIDERDLEVQEFQMFDPKTYKFDYKPVYQLDEAGFQDFLRAIKRFKNLRAFA